MQALEEECLIFLEANLQPSDVCAVLSSSHLIEDSNIIQKCWEFVDSVPEVVLKSDSFCHIKQTLLVAILERDTLSCSELTVFNAACSWAEVECRRRGEEHTPETIREILGDTLKYIRFPVMDPQDFANHVAKSGILEPMEVTTIFCYLKTHKQTISPYSDKQRIPAQQICSRFRSVDTNLVWDYYSGTEDAIQFSVARQVRIVGVRLYGSREGPCEYDVQVDVKEDKQVIATKYLKLQTDGIQETFPVIFEKPLQIQENKWYTIKAMMKGDSSFYGMRGLVRKSNESANLTDVERGQIPDIIFI